MNQTESQIWRWLQPFFQARELHAPDGRPLHEYKATRTEIAELESILIDCFKQSIPPNSALLGAAFCLWSAHWFQHEFKGGHWRWEDPLRKIGAPNDHHSRELLIPEGMRYLKRDIRKINGTRKFLVSIVLEGGFPSHLIANEGGWLQRFLEAVTLATGHGDLSSSAALDNAEHYQFIIPVAFRAESLLHLVADLARHVAELRRRLVQNGITEGAVEWLDHQEPGWRKKLPVATDDSAARALVEGLVRASPTKAIMPVSAKRMLKRIGERWSFSIRLDIEGRIDEADLPDAVREGLRSVNRARILPAGLLEKKGLPAIGVANRVEETDWRGWAVESLLRQPRLTIEEFACDADARLVFVIGNGPGIEFIPAGGGRVTSDVLVFKGETPAEGEDPPSLLTLVGTGSIKEREETLYALVPKDAALNISEDSEVVEVASVEAKKLWRIRGSVSFLIESDRYVVRTGVGFEDATFIEAIGGSPDIAHATHPIFLGCPKFIVHRGVIKRLGNRNDLSMRVAGRGRNWVPFESNRLPFGLVEVAAIDGGEILDRSKFIHLPKDAKIRRSIPQRGSCRIQLENFDGARFDPVDAPSNLSVQSCRHQGFDCTVTTPDADHADVHVRIRWNDSEAVLSVPVLTNRIAFYNADRRLISDRAPLSLAGLRGASVEADDRSSVVMTLHEQSKGDRPLSIERAFDRSLPFSQLRSDIEWLFSMTDDLDAEVRVEATHVAGNSYRVGIKRFDITLQWHRIGAVAFDAASRRRLDEERVRQTCVYGKPFRDTSGDDRKLENFELDGETCWEVPDGEGPWFVFAKIDGVARSRPLHINRELAANLEQTPYLAAVTMLNREDRKRQIVNVLSGIGKGRDAESLCAVLGFVGSVDPGLPLQSFDILRFLPLVRSAAVRMAVVADERILHRVVDIDQKLPFSWFVTHPNDWVDAISAYRSSYVEKMAGVDASTIARIVDEVARKRIYEIARRRPCLSFHLAVAMAALALNSDAACPETLAQACRINASGAGLSGHLIPGCRQAVSEALRDNDGRRWPTWVSLRDQFRDLTSATIETPPWSHFVLDAPFAAAVVATGEVDWTPSIGRLLRMAQNFDPSYFDTVFLYSLAIRWSRRTAPLPGAA